MCSCNRRAETISIYKQRTSSFIRLACVLAGGSQHVERFIRESRNIGTECAVKCARTFFFLLSPSPNDLLIVARLSAGYVRHFDELIKSRWLEMPPEKFGASGKFFTLVNRFAYSAIEKRTPELTLVHRRLKMLVRCTHSDSRRDYPSCTMTCTIINVQLINIMSNMSPAV